MAIYRDWNEMPSFKNAVITIGSFDGVHLGHQEILKEVVSLSDKYEGESVLITFHPHPRKIIDPYAQLALISDEEQKFERILSLGIDHIVLVPFTRDFSMWSAEDYIDDFLLARFKPKAIVLGYDHHFGHGRKGDIALLKEKVPSEVKVYEIKAQLIEHAAISSTKIRQAVLEGKVEEVPKMMGWLFSFKATVVHGNKLGRTIGFPTANLKLTNTDLIVPARGVYMVRVHLGEEEYAGMMNIGYKPSVSDDENLSIEVHILDFNQDIYGKEVEIECLRRIRDEQKFDGLEKLVEQLQKDRDWVKAEYGNSKY